MAGILVEMPDTQVRQPSSPRPKSGLPTPGSRPPAVDLDWLIIGGGIHGVHIAIRLLFEGADRDRLRILDPADRLLDRWTSCTEITGMEYLRSPAVHNLDVAPNSLRRFARKSRKSDPGLFAHPYERPTRALFNSHCDQLIQSHQLDALHLHGRALQISMTREAVAVNHTGGGTIASRRIVLAIGASDQPHWPEWAPQEHPRIRHAFDPQSTSLPPRDQSRVAVIGGGLSAAQIALRLSAIGHQVALVSRHPIRTHQFDSDPGWLGPKYMTGFHSTRDLTQRRNLIQEARHRGSISPDVRVALRREINRKRITWRNASIRSVTDHEHGVSLQLSHGGPVQVDQVVLATGFTTQRPGGVMLDKLIESAGLPCSACGYPVVDNELRWHPQIHVAGPLAELELGPTSRNIAGARSAGDRIVASLKRNAQQPT